MITTDTARKLLSLVNSKQNMERLSAYVADRLSFLHRELESKDDPTDIYRLQGQIKEVKRLLTLREEATQKAEEGKY
jgi:hypothetical protein